MHEGLTAAKPLWPSHLAPLIPSLYCLTLTGAPPEIRIFDKVLQWWMPLHGCPCSELSHSIHQLMTNPRLILLITCHLFTCGYKSLRDGFRCVLTAAVSLRNQAAGSVITRLHGEFIAICNVSVDYERICNKLYFGVAFLLLCAAMYVANQMEPYCLGWQPLVERPVAVVWKSGSFF